ncbi:hypothetical protein JXR93_04245 [bacterium]|nr:hypothetical protein [bacterium]
MREKISKTDLKGVSFKQIIIIITLFLTSLIFGYLFFYDMSASKSLKLAYIDTLHPKTKIELNKDESIHEMLKLFKYEGKNFYFYTYFIDKLKSKKIKQEPLLSLLYQTVSEFEKIKKSTILLDIKILVLTIWDDDKNIILSLIKESIDKNRDLNSHPILLNRKIIDKWGEDIDKISYPDSKEQFAGYFRFLYKAKKYESLVDFVEKYKKIHIDKELFNNLYTVAIANLKDLEKAEKKLLTLYKSNNNLFTRKHLVFLYRKLGYNDKIKELLKNIDTSPDEKIVLADIGFEESNSENSIRLYFKLPISTQKKECNRFFKYITKLDINKQEIELIRVKFICNQKIVYRKLLDIASKKGDKDKVREYQIKLK